MVDGYSGFENMALSDVNTRIRDLEERQRLLKDRTLLIGQNLIDFREETAKDVTELKIMTRELKQDLKKIKHALLRLTDEVDKRARSSDVELLRKQAKMFQKIK